MNSNCISNKLREINGFRQDIKIRIVSFLNYFVTHFKPKLKALCFCHTFRVSQKVRMYISRQAKMGDWLSPCNSCIFWRCCTKYKAFWTFESSYSLPVQCFRNSYSSIQRWYAYNPVENWSYSIIFSISLCHCCQLL